MLTNQYMKGFVICETFEWVSIKLMLPLVIALTDGILDHAEVSRFLYGYRYS